MRTKTPPQSGTPIVQIESPFAGQVEENERYARAAVLNSLVRGEAPFASHLLYTQPGILQDAKLEERQKGIDAGLAHLRKADKSAAYIDRGISGGMVLGINAALSFRVPVYFRSLEAPNVELSFDLVPAPFGPDRVDGIWRELVALEAAWQRLKGSGSTPFSVAAIDQRSGPIALDSSIPGAPESRVHRWRRLLLRILRGDDWRLGS